jgi:hypothetical protein
VTKNTFSFSFLAQIEKSITRKELKHNHLGRTSATQGETKKAFTLSSE